MCKCAIVTSKNIQYQRFNPCHLVNFLYIKENRWRKNTTVINERIFKFKMNQKLWIGDKITTLLTSH